MNLRGHTHSGLPLMSGESLDEIRNHIGVSLWPVSGEVSGRVFEEPISLVEFSVEDFVPLPKELLGVPRSSL